MANQIIGVHRGTTFVRLSYTGGDWVDVWLKRGCGFSLYTKEDYVYLDQLVAQVPEIFLEKGRLYDDSKGRCCALERKAWA